MGVQENFKSVAGHARAMNTTSQINLAEADLRLLEEHVRHLFVSMGLLPVTIRCHLVAPYLYIHIEAGNNGKLLIGPRGIHLTALQHIIRSLLRVTLDPGIRVLVDVNGYRARREQDLVNVAAAAAARAVRQGQPVILPPMGSADRRTIHTVLANRSDVTTESTGIEPKRSVVIKPVFL